MHINTNTSILKMFFELTLEGCALIKEEPWTSILQKHDKTQKLYFSNSFELSAWIK